MNANPMARKALKWADEVNDAVTVLHWRKKKGITVDESFNTAPAWSRQRSRQCN